MNASRTARLRASPARLRIERDPIATGGPRAESGIGEPFGLGRIHGPQAVEARFRPVRHNRSEPPDRPRGRTHREPDRAAVARKPVEERRHFHPPGFLRRAHGGNTDRGTGVSVWQHTDAGAWKLQHQPDAESRFCFQHTSYWHVFPDTAARRFDQVESWFDRHPMRPRDLRAFAKQPGVDRDAVRRVLLVREVQAQNLLLLASQMSLHPTLGQRFRTRDLLKKLLQSMLIASDDVLKTEQELEAEAAA